MRNRLLRIVVVLFLFAAKDVRAQLPLEPFPPKKFIELGWDIPNQEYLRRHHEEMQRNTPFDGVMLSLTLHTPEKKRISTQSIMDTTSWKPEWFEPVVADLKACKFTAWTDNFIRYNFTPGTIAWNDDDGWKMVCDKTGLCSKIAKETGLKGLALDFEPYGAAMFRYDAKTGLSFERTQDLARRRGREWMMSIAAEYPDMILMTLFILDFIAVAGRSEDPNEAMQTAHYGLLPAFFNGMLDVVPPTMRLIDGCETGYYLNGFDEFARRAVMLKSRSGPAARMVVSENRQRYMNQVEVGFGFYLDMYANPEGSKYYRGPTPGGTRLDRLKENLQAARDVTDEYVWIYGEQRRWWKPQNPEHPWESWEQALPGVTETIRFIKEPEKFLRSRFAETRKSDTAVNLVRNGDFRESKDGKTPAEWNSWQHEPLGVFSWDETVGGGSGRSTKVRWGCFLQKHPVKPGECYFVSVDAKKQDDGSLNTTVRWQDKDGKWTKESEDRPFAFKEKPIAGDDRPLKDGWSRAGGFVVVPESVAHLLILFGTKGQETDRDAAWFDDVLLIKLQ